MSPPTVTEILPVPGSPNPCHGPSGSGIGNLIDAGGGSSATSPELGGGALGTGAAAFSAGRWQPASMTPVALNKILAAWPSLFPPRR